MYGDKKMMFEPDLMRFSDGKKVLLADEWENRRKEILHILSVNEYGITPQKIGETHGTIIEEDYKCCSGHAVLEKLKITFPTPSGDFTFPVNYFRPLNNKKNFTFVFINFRPDVYDMYYPIEEIIDNGFGIAVFCYNDITSDNYDMNDKLASCFPRKNDGTDWGKIGMWAFAASRLADYLLTRAEVSKLAVIGHSRLGKTALWCGAQDSRFAAVISNDSGCSGAAYERSKHEGAETKEIISTRYPFWFCDNHKISYDDISRIPYDQHFLLSLIAPRLLCVGSASLDDWADPYSEQISCIGASSAWEIHNLKGYVGKNEQANIGDVFNEGLLIYHLREGIHFLGRTDWKIYMNSIKKVFPEDFAR